MDRLRNLPPDPVEAAQVPVEGVDLPESDQAVQGDFTPASDQTRFVENEGLLNRKDRDPARADDGVEGEGIGEAARAAQRGRTA